MLAENWVGGFTEILFEYDEFAKSSGKNMSYQKLYQNVTISEKNGI